MEEEGVAVVVVEHFGVKRRYFADGRLQELYEEMSGRKLVTAETQNFLELLGLRVVEIEEEQR